MTMSVAAPPAMAESLAPAMMVSAAGRCATVRAPIADRRRIRTRWTYFKQVNENETAFCLPQKTWLEALRIRAGYAVYRLETNSYGVLTRNQYIKAFSDDGQVQSYFAEFDRQMFEEGYVKEVKREKGGNSRGGIGLTPRRSPALRFLRALGLIPHALS